MGGHWVQYPVKAHRQSVKALMCEKPTTNCGHDFRDPLWRCALRKPNAKEVHRYIRVACGRDRNAIRLVSRDHTMIKVPEELRS